MNKKVKETAEMQSVKSSGNIFADLGVPDAEAELAKAELAFAIRQRIKAKGLNQMAAAELLGTDQSKISLLMNGKVGGFTYDRLLRFLNLLEVNVRLVVEPTQDQQPGKILTVLP
jgi:predicted XRE-type DNA-binding protein